MEQIVTTFEENERQLSKEGLEMRTDDLLILLVDQREYDITGLKGIRPLLHLESELNLGFSKLEQVLLAFGVIEFHGIRNLGVEKLIRVFLGLDELLEMVMQGVSQTTVFTLALEFVAKVEKRNSYRVVEVEQL